MPSTCILLLLDGLGDRAYRVLDGQTPLQAAATPNLDRVARLGINGIFHADRQGVALPSENAHFAMFGYAKEEFPGRGPLEALGAEIAIDVDDVAILAHFVSVREHDGVLYLVKDRPRADPEEIEALAGALSTFEAGDIRLRYVPTRHLDGILVIEGPVSPRITDTDPLWEGRPLIECAPLAAAGPEDAAGDTALALNACLGAFYRDLQAHPVNARRIREGRPPINAIATNRPGRLRPVQPFSERWGLDALSISSGLIYWGLAQFLGLHVLKATDSPDPGADIAKRLSQALDRKADYGFIHVHTKAPDVAAHAKDPMRKKTVIEALDRGLGPVFDRILTDPDILLIVTSDHSTPSAGPLIHSGESVPLAMVGEGVRRDAVSAFDEVSCGPGALGRIRGEELMPMVLNALDRAKLRGLMDTPWDQAFWPGRRRLFRVE